VVIPGYNESQSLPHLMEALHQVLSTLSGPYEVIFVDDGSRDETPIVLRDLVQKYPYLKGIRLARNYGQTMAIWVGIQEAQGEIIVLMDADLENDPADIPRLLEKMAEGYDVVSGWRQERWKGQWLTRRLPSLFANKLISWLSGVHLHDYGCTLKAYKREVIASVRLYGRMHRFIPIYAKWEGGRITEIPVRYQPRRFGRSHYGMMRIVSVLLDLIVILFLDKYLQRPMQFFGGAGLISIALGLGTFLWALYYKLCRHQRLRPNSPPHFYRAFYQHWRPHDPHGRHGGIADSHLLRSYPAHAGPYSGKDHFTHLCLSARLLTGHKP
jgi:glycosyltransferase involved in cell wall biosynthesis